MNFDETDVYWLRVYCVSGFPLKNTFFYIYFLKWSMSIRIRGKGEESITVFSSSLLKWVFMARLLNLNLGVTLSSVFFSLSCLFIAV
jgi:hypothetical protein